MHNEYKSCEVLFRNTGYVRNRFPFNQQQENKQISQKKCTIRIRKHA